MAVKGGLLSGALAGVTAGLLLAPKAGNVTQRWVRMKGGKLVKETCERVIRGEAAEQIG